MLLGCRDRQAGDEAAAPLVARGLAVEPVVVDVADPRSIAASCDELEARKITVEILVNNAGVYPQGGTLDTPVTTFREAFEVHVFGPLALCQRLVPGMRRRRWGRIVNVSSGYGAFSEGLEGPSAYSLSKAALDALTLKLAGEVGPDVKVNAVCPGWVRTRMGGAAAPRSPEEAADTIVWLATLPDGGPTGGFFRDRRPIPW